MSASSLSAPLSIFIVAAEESGDILGASLARALTARHGGELRLAGIGGRAMAAAGIMSPFPIDELSIIGLTAIPRRLPQIFRRIRETADAIVAARPNALVIIDSPEFTHRSPGGCGASRPRSRSSIMCRRRCGPGGRGARAPCAPMSTMCSLFCRSSRQSTYGLGGPPCIYVGHPLVERIARIASRHRSGAAPQHRPAGCPGAARQSQQRGAPAAGHIRRRDRAGCTARGRFGACSADGAACG